MPKTPRTTHEELPSKGRKVLFIFLLLCCVVPIVELAVMIQVAIWVGLWEMVGLLILGSVIGLLLVRYEGRSAWRRFKLALDERRVPSREAFDGAAILAAGGFLLFPGFVTDFCGLLLLFPPTRWLIRKVLTWWFMRQHFVAAITWKVSTGAIEHGYKPTPKPPLELGSGTSKREVERGEKKSSSDSGSAE
jgi:UPF0716 family protein affecting phage T7 exclusion